MRFLNNKILALTTIALLFSCTKFDAVKVNKVKTGPVTEITSTSATVDGTILEVSDQGIDHYGFFFSKNTDPTTGNHEKTDWEATNSKVSFVETLNFLDAGSTYFFAAYAENSDGVVLGDVMSFLTLTASVPTVSTIAISSVSQTSAVSGGNVTDNGGSTVTTRGVCWSRSPDPTITDSRSMDGNGTGAYISSISGLSCGITYFVRSYATNATGTVYGNQLTFTTNDCTSDPPSVTTAIVASVTETSAQGGGEVTNDGGSAVTVKGICWNTSQNPTISDSKTEDGYGTGGFTSAITGLTCGTAYYVRAYATNASGTSYGNEVEFSSTECPTGLPTVTTTAISNILETSAMSGGNVSTDGGEAVTVKGVCWSTSQNPTTADNNTSDGSATGGFTSAIIGLTCGTTYYVRAYATNANGTSYGEQESFTTSECQAELATLTTTAVSKISDTEAQSGGTVSDNGGATVTAKGVVWSTSENPTLSDSKTADGSGIGAFTSILSDLTCNTTYYVKAYATNSAGTAYGNQVAFNTTTCPTVATVTTALATNITESAAESGGIVSDNGGATIMAKGVVWSTSSGPALSDNYTTDGTGTGTFTSLIDGLSCGTTYYYRAYATNSAGTAYGDEYTFITTTCSNIASITTTSISNIGDSDAWGGGNVVSDNGSWVTDKGVVWSTSPIPTLADDKTNDGSGPGSFTSYLTGLSSYTTYYVRAYATNGSGTAYGEQVSFKTSTVTDYDGNIYKTVVIGSQTWMAENLRVTHYSDGTSIPYIDTDSDWGNLSVTDAAYSYYYNDPGYDIWGALYSWPAFMNGAAGTDSNPSGVQGVCPSGWHVPSDSEWKQLEIYLGMSQADADLVGESRGSISGKLKDVSSAHWEAPNSGATNETGFTAIGSGWRAEETSNATWFLKKTAFYWTTTYGSDPSTNARGRYIHHNTKGLSRWSDLMDSGMSVRCVKD